MVPVTEKTFYRFGIGRCARTAIFRAVAVVFLAGLTVSGWGGRGALWAVSPNIAASMSLVRMLFVVFNAYGRLAVFVGRKVAIGQKCIRVARSAPLYFVARRLVLLIQFFLLALF
jgi:hypothetical protein